MPRSTLRQAETIDGGLTLTGAHAVSVTDDGARGGQLWRAG